MANNCYIKLRVIAPHKKDLVFLRDILKDKTDITMSAYNGKLHKPFKRNDGLYEGVISAICSWSCSDFFNGFNSKCDDYINMIDFCHEYGVAAECWAQEYGFGFQQHFIIDNKGSVVCSLATINCSFANDDDDEPSEGGFYNFGVWSQDSLLLH